MAEPSGSQGALRRRPGGAVTANRNTTNRGSSSATMLKFYTDDSPGLKV
ncbi:7352_t:CDS:2, partial [Paraglomus occultum]